MPPAGFIPDRHAWQAILRDLKEARTKITNLERHLLHGGYRRHEAVWMPPGDAMFRLASLTETLSQGSTATVAELEYDEGVLVYTGEEFEVTDYWFNVGESAAADTKIIAQRFGDEWIVAQFYCSVSDTLPEE